MHAKKHSPPLVLRWCQKVAGVLVGLVGWLVGWLASCFVFFDTLLTVGTNLWLQHDIDRWDKPFGCAGRWDKPFGTT